MPHIHDKIDLTASAYIVYNDKVLLIHHKKLDKWMQVGGHVELDETPDQALLREIKEETGLSVDVLSEKPAGIDYPPAHVTLWTPNRIGYFKFGDVDHYHIDLTYYARAHSDKALLEEDGANAIRWFSEAELDEPKYSIEPAVKYDAKAALKRATQ
jgi:8-oxo-dGTP pyrophosphatase MutT (NUDIX family)